MASKILELRRKVSGSFNHNDSLSYVRTNWSGIDGKPSVYPPTGHQHTIAQVGGLQDALKEDSVFYIAGTGTTAGAWLGSHSKITSYYDGLVIAYKIGIAGASTTTLNINGFGARTVRRNTSNTTTHLPVNTVVLLTYTTISGTGYWVWADYDSTRSLITQAAIDTGTETTARSINALLLRNNFYLKSEAYNKTEIDNSVVKRTGDQTIAGNKTFTNGITKFANPSVSGNPSIVLGSNDEDDNQTVGQWEFLTASAQTPYNGISYRVVSTAPTGTETGPAMMYFNTANNRWYYRPPSSGTYTGWQLVFQDWAEYYGTSMPTGEPYESLLYSPTKNGVPYYKSNATGGAQGIYIWNTSLGPQSGVMGGLYFNESANKVRIRRSDKYVSLLDEDDLTNIQSQLGSHVTYKGLLGTTNLNTLNTEAAQGIYSQNSNANATLARNYPTASSGAGLLRVYWTGANSGVVQEYNNYIDGRIYVRAYQGSSWSGWSTIADRSWVTSNTRSSSWTPTWAQVSGKPSFATVATSGSYSDLSNRPTIPAAQVQTNWNATSGMGAILNKPNLSTVATSGSYNDLSNKPSIPSIPSVMTTSEGNTGSATTQRTINAANLKSIILNHSPAGSRPSNDVAGWAKSGNSSVLPAGKVGSNSSLESSDKFLTNAQTFKYVSKSDVGLANVPNVDATDPTNISQSADYRFVTDNEKNAWNNKWKQIYAGTSPAIPKGSFVGATVPSDVYANKVVAIEIKYGSTGNTYTNKIVFVTLGTDTSTGGSKTHPRFINFSEFDGQYLKNISVKCYVTTSGTTASIRFGVLRTLVGSFSGTTIDWTTQDSDSINVYIGKIWVLD